MKAIMITLPILLLSMAGCLTPHTKYDAAMTIAVDQTDLLNQYPTAAQLLLPLGLKDNPDMGVTISVLPLTDRDINPAFTFTLDREDALTGNSQLREILIKAFIQKVQHCLDTLKPRTSMRHSVIYRPVIAQANNLASISARRRYLVLISDLEENAAISFYSRDTQYALAHKPELVKKQLEQEAKLKNLKGIDLWLLYRPKDYQDNKPYRIASGFYQRLFSQHGASVHIDQNFNPLL